MQYGGEVLTNLFEERAEQGLETPLDDKPEIFEDLLYAWSGFAQLSASRQRGMGATPISVADIYAWLEINSINSTADSDEKTEFLLLIQALDAYWIKWIEQHQPKS